MTAALQLLTLLVYESMLKIERLLMMVMYV